MRDCDALDQFHDQVRDHAVDVHVMDRDDIGMDQASDRSRLPVESFERRRLLKPPPPGHFLDRHGAVKPAIASKPHRGRSATPQQAPYLVPVTDHPSCRHHVHKRPTASSAGGYFARAASCAVIASRSGPWLVIAECLDALFRVCIGLDPGHGSRVGGLPPGFIGSGRTRRPAPDSTISLTMEEIYLTMAEAAIRLGVSTHRTLRL